MSSDKNIKNLIVLKKKINWQHIAFEAMCQHLFAFVDVVADLNGSSWANMMDQMRDKMVPVIHLLGQCSDCEEEVLEEIRKTLKTEILKIVAGSSKGCPCNEKLQRSAKRRNSF